MTEPGPVTPPDVEAWFTERLTLHDAALGRARERATAAGLPDIAVSPGDGALLHLLARVRGARRILEIGTLGGYSTVWLARALPADGEVVTLEIDPTHADVARACVDDAGVGDRVRVVVGAALDTLPTLDGPFDLVFVDADKENNPGYVRAALELVSPGAVLVIDNVVRDGLVADPTHESAMVQGVRDVIDLVATEPRLEALTPLQTVGSKGWDGMLLARVRG